MKTPELVHDIAKEAIRACEGLGVPVSVKHRLGVDDHDSWEELVSFVRLLANAGVTHFTVHARKALLGVLSAEGNRTIPPLRYDWVFALAAAFPELSFELNGGVSCTREALRLLAADDGRLGGVMVGRAAYKTPWVLADADRAVFGRPAAPSASRAEVLERYLEYAAGTFSERTRSGRAPPGRGAEELEDALAAPVSFLFEDQGPEFREALLQGLAELRGSGGRAPRGGPPQFLLRRAALAAAAAEAAAASTREGAGQGGGAAERARGSAVCRDSESQRLPR
ncbi:unnamed protein product [Prorocentrum cordatum]|uniref:DUS-like FMN-binding domain-containing protein n=1 Tax=Prorocentrum cordatum TaxID=2364126 RepID=A0ABN9USX1_9DINO|nr:unnamed protein product [Polarella glacialis]